MIFRQRLLQIDSRKVAYPIKKGAAHRTNLSGFVRFREKYRGRSPFSKALKFGDIINLENLGGQIVKIHPLLSNFAQIIWYGRGGLNKEPALSLNRICQLLVRFARKFFLKAVYTILLWCLRGFRCSMMPKEARVSNTCYT